MGARRADRAHEDAFCGFAKDLGLTVFFTLHAAPGPRDEEKRWTSDNAREGMTYMLETGCPVEVSELGNEINGFQAIHGLDFRVTGEEHAADVGLGETGHAQCGGQPGISENLISSLWWLDPLGKMARCGQPVVVRQTLLGGDDQLLDEETLEPTPDDWASLLEKRLMGERVLDGRVPHVALPSASWALAVFPHARAPACL